MYNIIDQNTIRRIDKQGRVIIPKSIRDMFQWDIGDEVNFYVIYENNLPTYIGMRRPVNEIVDPKYEAAANVLEELNIEIPIELAKKINGDK